MRGFAVALGRAAVLTGGLVGGLAGCLRQTSHQCANGSWCPEGKLCVSAAPFCVSPSLTEACTGLADHDDCSFLDVQGVVEGKCITGACTPCSPDLAGCEAIGWLPMTSPTGGAIRAIRVFDPTTAFAVGASGTLLSYEDGRGWTESARIPGLGMNSELTSLWGRDRSNLFALSSTGEVLVFDGATWSTNTPPSTFNLAALGGTSDQLYGVGLNEVWRYEGGTWSMMTMAAPTPLTAVWGSSASDVFAVGTGGQNGAVHHHGGGMQSWLPMTLPTVPAPTPPLKAVWGSGPADVFAVGEAMTIVHFDGSAWTRQAVPARIDPTLELTTVWGTGPDDVFAAGGNAVAGSGVLLHYDGTAWLQMQTPSGARVLSISGSDGRSVIAVTEQGAIWRYTGAAWSVVTPLPTMNAIRGLAGTRPDDVVAVGDVGTIVRLRADDDWDDKTVEPTGMHGVWGRSADGLVFVVGDANLMLRSVAGGGPWQEVTRGAGRLRDVAGSDGRIFACGSDGVLALDEGSAGWQTLAAADGQLNGVWAHGPSELTVVGEHGVFAVDGGALRSLHAGVFMGVWADDELEIAVGALGSIVTRRGSSWTPTPPVTLATLHDVAGTSTNLFAAGDDGTILRFERAGDRQWRRVALPLAQGSQPPNVYAAWASGPNAWFAGDGGSIYRLILSAPR